MRPGFSWFAGGKNNLEIRVPNLAQYFFLAFVFYVTGTSSLFACDEKFLGALDSTIIKSNGISIFGKISDPKRQYKGSDSGYKILACSLVEYNALYTFLSSHLYGNTKRQRIIVL